MAYVIGVVAGLLLGGIIGYLKHCLLWKKYLQKIPNGQYENSEAGGVYARAIISNFVNILTLVVVFLLRDMLPFNGIAFLFGTALSLAMVNQILAVRQRKIQERMRKGDCAR